MANVTYILGAGASHKALPVSGEIKDSLDRLQAEVRRRIEKLVLQEGKSVIPGQFRPPPSGEYAKALFEAFDRLHAVAKSHPSLDTYARKLLLRNAPGDDKQTLWLKAAMACYFLLLQSLSGVDQRYDHFFASVLDRDEPGKPKLPKGLSILTWNYDLQLEKSFAGFTNNQDHLFRTISLAERVLRLNGVSLSPIGASEFMDLAFQEFDLATPGRICDLYRRMSFEVGPWIPPQISFAWEGDQYQRLHGPLQEICTSTETAVFIGYSFPYFNRETDALILKMMLSSGLLRTVYVQAMSEDHEAIKERIRAAVGEKLIGRFRILMVGGCDLFYLPAELERAP